MMESRARVESTRSKFGLLVDCEKKANRTSLWSVLLGVLHAAPNDCFPSKPDIKEDQNRSASPESRSEDNSIEADKIRRETKMSGTEDGMGRRKGEILHR